MVDETGIAGNVRIGVCSESTLFLEVALTTTAPLCPALSCTDKGDLPEEGPPPLGVVASTSLRLNLATSEVEKDRSLVNVGSLAKGSATAPSRNLDAGRSLRSGVTLPPVARERRRRKQNSANPHNASKPTAPAVAPPAIAATLFLHKISIHPYTKLMEWTELTS